MGRTGVASGVWHVHAIYPIPYSFPHFTLIWCSCRCLQHMSWYTTLSCRHLIRLPGSPIIISHFYHLTILSCGHMSNMLYPTLFHYITIQYIQCIYIYILYVFMYVCVYIYIYIYNVYMYTSIWRCSLLVPFSYDMLWYDHIQFGGHIPVCVGV